MKVPLVYPKIPDAKDNPLKNIIAFNKYDGTNMHWVWNSEYGFHTFGTRRNQYALNEFGINQFKENHSELIQAPDLFSTNYESLYSEYLSDSIFSDKEVILFTEFLGEQSFAGNHIQEDNKQIILFDVQINNKLLLPEMFLKHFNSFNIAKIVYKGKFSGQFIEDVRSNKFKTSEGVICKGSYQDELYMFKIKTTDYLNKLKVQFADSWQEYWE